MTRKYRKINEYIRRSVGYASIEGKMRKNMLRYTYGQLLWEIMIKGRPKNMGINDDCNK